MLGYHVPLVEQSLVSPNPHRTVKCMFRHTPGLLFEVDGVRQYSMG